MTKQDIYNYFLRKCFQEPDKELKANLLCYFAYGWGLVFLHKEIADFKFEATPKEIVDPSLNEEEFLYERHALVDYLYFVWIRYGHFSAEELLERVETHSPYTNALNNKKPLKKKDISKFFKGFSH